MSAAAILEPAMPSTAPVTAASPAVVHTALIVDAVTGLLGTITAHLEHQLVGASYRVLTARDFREAIGHLAAVRPDVVAVDLDLPRDGGYAICEYMRAMPAHAAVPIVMTAVCDLQPGRFWAKGVGPCAFLRKPYSMLQLARVLEAAVCDHGAARA